MDDNKDNNDSDMIFMLDPEGKFVLDPKGNHIAAPLPPPPANSRNKDS
jgi:hypothetical protein